MWTWIKDKLAWVLAGISGLLFLLWRLAAGSAAREKKGRLIAEAEARDAKESAARQAELSRKYSEIEAKLKADQAQSEADYQARKSAMEAKAKAEEEKATEEVKAVQGAKSRKELVELANKMIDEGKL